MAYQSVIVHDIDYLEAFGQSLCQRGQDLAAQYDALLSSMADQESNWQDPQYRNDLLVSWMGYEYDALGRVISACTKKEISVPTYPDYSGKWHVVPSSGSEYDMNFTLSDIPPEIHSVEITDTRTNTKKYFYVPQEWEWDEADGAYHSGTVTHDGTNFTGTYGIYQEFENESHVYNYTQITTYPASVLSA